MHEGLVHVRLQSSIHHPFFPTPSAQLLGADPVPSHRIPHKSSVGDHSEGGTPSPIPNLVVKPFRADGSRGASPRKSRSSPTELFYSELQVCRWRI
jgi:hypothetical protein